MDWIPAFSGLQFAHPLALSFSSPPGGMNTVSRLIRKGFQTLWERLVKQVRPINSTLPLTRAMFHFHRTAPLC